MSIASATTTRSRTRHGRSRQPSRDWTGYIDCGKTNCRVGMIDRHGMSVAPQVNYNVADFSSVDQILNEAFRHFGGVPQRMVLALPGPIDTQAGTVRLLDLDGWPVFDLGQFERAYNCRGMLVNDLQLQAAGCQYNLDNQMDPFQHFRLVKAAASVYRNWKDAVRPNGRVVVATLTTGDNFSAYSNKGMPWGFEGGHFNIVPKTADEKSYCDFSRQYWDEEGSRAERLIGGARAFNTAVEWLYSLDESPSDGVAAEISAALKNNKGVGPVITAYPDDPFCSRIIRVLGGLMGNWLCGVAEIMQPDGLMVMVGTIMTEAGHLFIDSRRSPFVWRLTDSIPYADRLAMFTFVICDDPDLARKGAYVLAQHMR